MDKGRRGVMMMVKGLEEISSNRNSVVVVA